jgi:hypothetical protein
MPWTFTVGATVATFSERFPFSEWDSQPVIDVAKGLGSDEHDISDDGLGVPVREIAVQVKTEANHLALVSLKNGVGTLSDGTDSWTAKLVYYLAPRISLNSDLRQGVARFMRSS